MNTKVVNIRNDKYDVYIGRANYYKGLQQSKWHNPYYVDMDGTREEVIEKYRKYILASPDLLLALPELKDKTLGCWCKPLACHGDVLVELVDLLQYDWC